MNGYQPRPTTKRVRVAAWVLYDFKRGKYLTRQWFSQAWRLKNAKVFMKEHEAREEARVRPRFHVCRTSATLLTFMGHSRLEDLEAPKEVRDTYRPSESSLTTYPPGDE